MRTTVNRKREIEREMFNLFESGQKFLVVDTETTGFINHPGAQVVELAAVNQSGETVFHSLFKADIPMPSDAQRVHGISEAMLLSEPTFKEVSGKLNEVLCAYDLVFYFNTNFDWPMIVKTYKRFGVYIPEFLIKQQKRRCVMTEYAEYYGAWDDYHKSYEWQSLKLACRQLKVQQNGAHRALGDALSTLGIMRALAGRCVQEG